MKLTIIHPAVGKIPGKRYIRAWQMEPLSVAQLVALMPKDIELSFWDDRMEEIPYNLSADLVVMSVETYTAKRAYQIASKYREKNIPVIMGGFHATLCPDEVAEYAESIVVGDAENIWENVINDFKKGNLKQRYEGETCKFDQNILPDRSIYKGKNYIRVTLIESGRGCRFNCEFCSIHNFYKGKHHFKKTENVVNEISELKKSTKLFFFVDDNIVSDQNNATKLFNALVPLNVKWVGQADITIAKNPDLLELMIKSGCQGVLIGFESLSAENLKRMKKGMMTSIKEIEMTIKTIHMYGLRIYATFIFGYDYDKLEVFNEVLRFCILNKVFMVGFNHLTPFPGTELYKRLKKEGKLLYDKWWLSDEYTYGQIPFKSKVDYGTIENECRRIRRKFYGLSSVLYRMTNMTNINSMLMFSSYLYINTLLRKDTLQRKLFPLGDVAYNGELIKVKQKMNV